MKKEPTRRPSRPTRKAPSPRTLAAQWARQWLLRGLLVTGGWRRLQAAIREEIDEDYDDMDCDGEEATLYPFLGLKTRILLRARPPTVESAYRTALTQAERCPCPPIPALAALGQELGLSELEQAVLLFVTLAKSRGPFRHGLSHLGTLTHREEVMAAIGACLDAPPEAVAALFAPQAPLVLAGFIGLDADGFGSDLDDWLEILPGLGDRLLEPKMSSTRLLAAYVKGATEAPRALADFAHLTTPLSVLRPLLAGAMATHRPGVNVLLYGPPGTGKTALVRALAQDLTVRLLEVAVAQDDGQALSATGRVKALRLVGHLGASVGDSVILFDEVEDYFSTRYDPEEGPLSRGPGKGYSVDLLEQAPAPTVWITNRIDTIDPALLRRFSAICEIGEPPIAVRVRLVAQYLTPLGLADHPLAARLTQQALVPGLLAQAAATTQVAGVVDPDERAALYEDVINGLSQALGRPVVPTQPVVSWPYDLAYVNAHADLAAVAAGLARVGRGTVLCYGPAGTGKTALGRFFADSLQRPLLTYRASDLLDPYVGVAEQRMAAMFHRAQTERAVLLLDECDSFLRSRKEAVRSWEVTQVNEMLTQMESFTGLFIATTNLIDDLDDAAFRRFDVKLALDPLTGAQRGALIAAVLSLYGHAPHFFPDTELALLEGLTPGDMTTALKGLALRLPQWTPADLMAALHIECLPKRKHRGRPMGFMADFS